MVTKRSNHRQMKPKEAHCLLFVLPAKHRQAFCCGDSREGHKVTE